MQLCQWAGMRLLGLNDREGLWSKKEEFWRNKQIGDFPRKNVFKKGLLTFFNKHLLSGKTFLKEISYKGRFMGKRSKSLLFF